MSTIKQLQAIVGSLSSPSKMPGWAYGIPAQNCILGSILAKKKGSVCFSCYALKGMYTFPVVKAAQRKRLESISQPNWVDTMTELIGKKYRKVTGSGRVFRWHDSGDLQSVEHFSKIVEIANNLPDIRFWIPTRERKIVQSFKGEIPSNLVVRISMQMVGQEAVKSSYPQSTVDAEKGFQCPAPNQENSCGDCRACWNPEIPSVNYHKH
jgi:hypothetical protein